MTAALGDLLEAISAVPALPGARCRGRWELFDATIHSDRGAPNTTTNEARHEALEICADCPALENCRAWVDSLPAAHRPHGVVAGQLRTERARRRPGKESA